MKDLHGIAEARNGWGRVGPGGIAASAYLRGSVMDCPALS